MSGIAIGDVGGQPVGSGTTAGLLCVGGGGGGVEGEVGLLAQVCTPALVHTHGGGWVGGANGRSEDCVLVRYQLQHLVVVVVRVGAVDVAPTVVQNSGVPHGILRQVAPVDKVAIQGEANMGGVGINGGVVGGRVQAHGTKGVPVQVRDAPTLPSVLIAPIDLALLRRVGATVVKGGVNGLALNGGTHSPILGQSVLDLATDTVLEERALDNAIGSPNIVVVARGIGSGQGNWCHRLGWGGGEINVKVWAKRGKERGPKSNTP